MATFYDPGSDAGKPSGACIGGRPAVAGSSRRGMYSVPGALLSGVHSLRQVLDQLATAHASNRSKIMATTPRARTMLWHQSAATKG